MKVLYLNHPEADYAGYGLYAGLCQVLGADRVIDFPSKRSYHGEIHLYPSPYPSRWPPEEGTVQAGGHTEPFEYAVPTDTRAHDETEIRQMLAQGAFDLTVCEGPRKTVLSWLAALRGQLPRIVLLDGEDYADIHADLIDQHAIGLYLKRELFPGRPQRVGACDVKPFPFSTCLLERPAEGERDIDVHCAVGDTNPKRAQVRAAVERLGQAGYRVSTADTRREFPAGGWWRPYVERLARSKIVVAPRGWGQDTLRRWDAPAAGALLLQERLEIIDPCPLIDGVHKVDYRPDGTDFEETLRHWLGADEARQKVARAGQDLVFLHHTAAARARQLFAWARERWPELP